MKGKLLVCALEGCDETFYKTTHNMKYHSAECCRIATNKKIMEKYYEKRARRLGHVRYCNSCAVTKLSRYNDTGVCGGCAHARRERLNNSLTAMIENVILP